ncbi:MAG: DNA polymerase III subunit gamma/tau [Zetaproteobacteria bacterium]|nr:MAG: DNA polymerase III subunit gamma/tau [Zetaproteobacteria bacterium]
MAYLVLARRWRPRRFSDLVGQDVVVRTLRNALAGGKLAHAYLFCGIRGVGKTTLARLMAMAVNCLAPDDGEPCGACSACKAIMDDGCFDVREMDAASHTGVDDIREILDGVRYPPNALKYKVYIIDEAHMLSKSAFNALLKTLEEPPANVLFILATTEADRLPVTVRSRCQRFDLRRLSVIEIRDYLAHVLRSEQVDADESALAEIARAADGSVRDALSLAERVLAYVQGKVRLDDVRAALGLVDRSLSRALSEAVFNAEGSTAVRLLRDAVRRGQSARAVLKSLAELWHELMCMRVDEGLLEEGLEQEYRAWLAQWMPRITVTWLDLRYQILLHGLRDLHVVDEQLGAEMLLLRLCALHELDARGGAPKAVPRPQAETAKAYAGSHDQAAKPAAAPVGETGTLREWREAVEAYADVRPGVAAVLEHVLCLEFGKRVRLALRRLQEQQLAGPERQAFAEWLGREVFWERLTEEHKGETLSEQRKRRAQVEADRLRGMAEADPHVQQLQAELGATLVDVEPAGTQKDQ